jgi:hypothetical protein
MDEVELAGPSPYAPSPIRTPPEPEPTRDAPEAPADDWRTGAPSTLPSEEVAGILGMGDFLPASNEQVDAIGIWRSSALRGPFLAGLAERKPDFDALDRLVAGADPNERQAAYRCQEPQTAIRNSNLGAGEQLALSTALAEGSLKWARSMPDRDNDFYDFFVLGGGKGPPPAMEAMNCWELALYSAWRLHQIPTRWITEHYDTKLDQPSYEDLGFSRRLPVCDPIAGRLPAAGDLVFSTHRNPDGTPHAEPWHAMVSLGGELAMSLWKLPQPDGPARRLNLSEYWGDRNDIVQFGPAAWNQ